MKTNNQTQYTVTTITTYNKSTKLTTVSETRPANGLFGLSVLVDTSLKNSPVVNPHEFRKTYNTGFVGSYYRDDSTATSVTVGRSGGFNRNPIIPNVNALRNAAIGDLYDQLRSGGAGSGLDLAVDIAEAHQIRRMLAGVASLSRYVRGFKPSEWHRRWLEYQYGWRPLVNSVYGSFDAIMHRRLYQYQRIKGKARDRSLYQETVTDGQGPGSREIYTFDAKSRYMIVAEFEMKNTTRQVLSGYTSLNPVSIAWELTPYSFVVDWLIDIGGYLRAVEGALLFGQGFKRGYEVGGYRSKVGGSLFTYRPLTSGVTQIWDGEGQFQYTYKTRIPLGVWPFPTLPHFKVDLGSTRLISAASLLGLHLGRK